MHIPVQSRWAFLSAGLMLASLVAGAWAWWSSRGAGPGDPGFAESLALQARLTWASLGLILAALGAIGVYLQWYYLRHRRAGRGQCLHCGYDVAGNLSGTCPECGRPITGAEA